MQTHSPRLYEECGLCVCMEKSQSGFFRRSRSAHLVICLTIL